MIKVSTDSTERLKQAVLIVSDGIKRMIKG